MDKQHDSHHDSHSHHLVPFSVYIKTLTALLVLTVLTVGVSYIDFGKGNIFVSMGVATIKAALVMLFFMGLRWDTWLNRVIIVSSFAALGLFLFFSAADLWTKHQPPPVKVVQAAMPISNDELRQLEKGSAELIAHGKELYATNCATCHGATGHGDGASGASLNPKPRNFAGASAAEWKNGSTLKSIYVTLAYGVGTGMASYKVLSPKDRLALAHFVRTFVPAPAAASAGDARYAQALKDDGIGGSGPVKRTIPVEVAIERMLQE